MLSEVEAHVCQHSARLLPPGAGLGFPGEDGDIDVNVRELSARTATGSIRVTDTSDLIVGSIPDLLVADEVVLLFGTRNAKFVTTRWTWSVNQMKCRVRRRVLFKN